MFSTPNLRIPMRSVEFFENLVKFMSKTGARVKAIIKTEAKFSKNHFKNVNNFFSLQKVKK